MTLYMPHNQFPDCYFHLHTANTTHSTPEVTIDMKRCSAYEVTTLAKQKVVMKANTAYEQVKLSSFSNS